LLAITEAATVPIAVSHSAIARTGSRARAERAL
jgi:hypothetical protein